MNDLFLRAVRGEDTERAPIWLMRQAGRHLPEYRALKERHAFWELARTPELAAEVTLQPVRRYGLDAAILFQDIMTPLPAMGVDVDFQPGPIIRRPVRQDADVDALRVPDAGEIAPFVPEAIRLLRGELQVPLIGFGGAPLTLATYLVEGGGSKEYPQLRGLLRARPALAHRLLDKLTDTTIAYLRAQIEAGAQAVQLFDSWAGLHDARTYAAFGRPYAARVLEALADTGVPRIYIAVGAAHLYDAFATLPLEALSVDWRTPLDQVRAAVGGRVPALQGNLDPAALLGPAEAVRNEAVRVLRAGLGGAHVFNLGHGMLPMVDPARVEVLVDTVRSFDRHAATAEAPA
ncbi:MAG: uroporphyrinogen decarboxylase [Trueperaceae bacterium]|nr:uroporphyrinogen decarboxylase [Trueperaceae bacterium]